MSMLAEPRRKQKWSVDPRNSAWSNDDSKFGQKMLERMGWSKGKGLGRSEQGSTEHIKVKVKNNNYGLGTTASYEDNWIAHQDDFNELLAQLNNQHGQNKSPKPPAEEQKGFSLEEKSKTSTKRVHYMKFTKGKDLSSRTETDLNCIFGKRAKSARDQEQESNSSDSHGETEEPSSHATPESITKTVTSTLSMQEYFAQRMAQLKKARGQAQSTAPSVELEEANGTLTPSEEPSPICSQSSDSAEPKQKKKKKKSKKSSDELVVAEENSSTAIIVEDDEDQQQEHPGKKKKKRKMAENEEATNENCSSTSGVEQNGEELPPSKKKKKKKLKKDNKETGLLNGHGPTEDQTVESEVVHKKTKKHREEVDNVVKDDKEAVVEKKSKKDKKKKKKHQE